MDETISLTWPQIEKLVDNLFQQLSNLPIWHGKPYQLAKDVRDDYIHFPEIVGVSKGGLVPAVMLAYKFGLNKSHFGADQYIFDNVRTQQIGAWAQTHIIVDDIADRGNEQQKLQEYYSDETFPNHRFIFATLVTRSSCPIDRRPHLWALTYPGREYIIFPWAPDDLPNRGEEIKSNVLLPPDPGRSSSSRDETFQDGGGEVRGEQLAEGYPVQQPDQPHGETSLVPQDATPLSISLRYSLGAGE